VPHWSKGFYHGAAATGGLAYLTVPAHTEAGHGLMLWHLGFGLTMLVMFTWVSISRWRRRSIAANKPQLITTLFGTLLLMVTGHIGGSVVFHHGAGVDPAILSQEIREGHSHANGHSGFSESGSELHKSGPSGHSHN